MRLGYACINTSLDCTSGSTFRLKSYSEEKLIEKVQSNLDCFMRILKWNVENDIYFFRLGSGLVPFASHPVCKFNWQEYFKEYFEMIGKYIRKNKIRVTMHPDQFVIINSASEKIIERSIMELKYHCEVLDLLGLGTDSKMTIHVGGVYGDKEKSIDRFVSSYKKLPLNIKKRLVIENDHVSYSLRDCLKIHKRTGVPVVFDTFHHECLNNGEGMREAVLLSKKTWKKSDGDLIVHYSSQKKGGRKGSHSESVDIRNFKKIMKEIGNLSFDLMLEIKDKEKSLLKIREALR
ncbi:MAG: UV DNA damage repair endonuclease UvsE [archaeon]